ncbi:MAG: antitoxin [Chloroflexi bacterium]|nr:antitoxin [Chloroflexota bacterium]
MRTTLSIDDDVLEAARGLAEAEHVPLGQAVSILARRGLKRLGLRPSAAGIPVFDTPDDFPTVTDEDVARILADFP